MCFTAFTVYCSSVSFCHLHPQNKPRNKEVIKITSVVRSHICFLVEMGFDKIALFWHERFHKKRKSGGFLLSFNIDGLFLDGTSQRSKRVSENMLCCRNISWDSASLSRTTFQSGRCVYLVHIGDFFSTLQNLVFRLSDISVLLFLVKVSSRWTSVPGSDPLRSQSSKCSIKFYCVCMHVFAWLVCACVFLAGVTAWPWR